MCQPEADLGSVLLRVPLWGEMGFPYASHHEFSPSNGGKPSLWATFIYVLFSRDVYSSYYALLKYTSKHFTNITDLRHVTLITN